MGVNKLGSREHGAKKGKCREQGGRKTIDFMMHNVYSTDKHFLKKKGVRGRKTERDRKQAVDFFRVQGA